MFEKTITYSIILIIIALILLLIGVVVSYLRLIKKFYQRRDEDVDPAKILKIAQAKSSQMLEEANNVLTQAHKKAAEVISSAREHLTENEAQIDKALGKATQVYAEKYQNMLNITQSESIKVFQNLPSKLESAFHTEIEKIFSNLSGQVQAAQDDASEIVRKAYLEVEKEVEEYKKQRMKQVDDSLILILENIARKVLAKEITPEEHEKLVMKALQEAKKQGLFGL